MVTSCEACQPSEAALVAPFTGRPIKVLREEQGTEWCSNCYGPEPVRRRPKGDKQ